MSTASAQEETSTATPSGETSLGLAENIAAALAYAIGFISGIVLLLVEKDNERVRFHAAQSIVVFGGLFLVGTVLNIFASSLAFASFGTTAGAIASGIVGVLFGVVSMAIWLASLVLWIYLIVKTYQGGDPRVPVAAGLAERLI